MINVILFIQKMTTYSIIFRSIDAKLMNKAISNNNYRRYFKVDRIVFSKTERFIFGKII